MKITITPSNHGRQYEHDCDNCLFLGKYEYDAPHAIEREVRSEFTGVVLGMQRTEYTVPVIVDLYYCPGGVLGGSMIARHGDRPEQYASCATDILETMIDNIINTPANKRGTFTLGYVEAFLRAEKEGLYTRKVNNNVRP